MPKHKSHAIEMSREEWFNNDKYPYFPFERDFKKHGEKLMNRPDFNPDHPTLGQACHLVTVTSRAATYKVNGMTTTDLAKQGKVNYPATVHGVHFYCETMEEAQVIYKGFDNPGASKGSQDKLFSALKANGVDAKSKTFQRGAGTTGASIAYNSVHGARSNAAPPAMEQLVGELKFAFRAVDGILVLAEENRVANVATLTPIIAAMLATFRKECSIKDHATRQEHIREWAGFWEAFVTSAGMHQGNPADTYNVLFNKVATGMKGTGGSRESSLEWTEKSIWCYDTRDSRMGKKFGTVKLVSYFPQKRQKFSPGVQTEATGKHKSAGRPEDTATI